MLGTIPICQHNSWHTVFLYYIKKPHEYKEIRSRKGINTVYNLFLYKPFDQHNTDLIKENHGYGNHALCKNIRRRGYDSGKNEGENDKEPSLLPQHCRRNNPHSGQKKKQQRQLKDDTKG